MRNCVILCWYRYQEIIDDIVKIMEEIGELYYYVPLFYRFLAIRE